MTPPRSFSEFWPYYLGEHRNPLNRALHYVGTFCALSLLGYIITRQYWGLMLVGLVIGYGPAWVGHFFIENNKPASFKYPLWSFMADVKMLVLKAVQLLNHDSLDRVFTGDAAEARAWLLARRRAEPRS